MSNKIKASDKIVVAVVFSVVVLSYAGWKSPFFNPELNNYSVVEISAVLEENEYTLDTDNDGVRDWQEILLGTDPNNPDTNGDGISDGEEIEALAIEEVDESLSATQTLTKQILSSYVHTKQQNTYDEDAFGFVIAQAANEQFAIRYIPTYTRNDILTSKSSSSNTYANEFNSAIKPVLEVAEYELATYGRAIEEGIEEDFEKLLEASVVYRDIADTLLEIEVPEDAVIEHLDLVNSFATFSRILSSMSNGDSDPVSTLVMTRDFFEGEDAIKVAYSQVNIYFILNNSNL
ncbi:hypothetical protein COB52_02145 [Candidatus Kaiserbacteria bacterium]|nr:MAG: hypothetical protein COB52_02145 [Candidatus Kaiserbacteria bacterium]